MEAFTLIAGPTGPGRTIEFASPAESCPCGISFGEPYELFFPTDPDVKTPSEESHGS